MPRKDTTFTEFDLLRIYTDHLTKKEQKSFVLLFNSLDLEDATDLCIILRNMVDLGEEISTILIPLRAIPGIAFLVAAFDGYVFALKALERTLCGRR